MVEPVAVGSRICLLLLWHGQYMLAQVFTLNLSLREWGLYLGFFHAMQGMKAVKAIKYSEEVH